MPVSDGGRCKVRLESRTYVSLSRLTWGRPAAVVSPRSSEHLGQEIEACADQRDSRSQQNT